MTGKISVQFEKNFDTSVARVKKRLAVYLSDPADENNVHDMRTSLRRLEAAFSLLPKNERKKNKKQADACKALFRANSRVRDFDIIKARVLALGGEKFVDATEAKRKAALGRALALARSVEKNMHRASSAKSIDEVKLAARMDKVAGRLVCAIKKRVPVVATNSRKNKELHDLRKDLKKLRYVLETFPAGCRKKHAKKLARVIKVAGGSLGKDKSNVMARLKELQDILGRIRDCDITLEYLQRVKGADKIMMMKEKAERDALYEKFTKSIS